MKTSKPARKANSPRAQGTPRPSNALLENYLLESAPAKALEAMKPHLQHVPLSLGHLIYAPMKPIREVFFPTAGLISVVATMKDGSTIEVGLVSKDGMAGVPLLLGVEFMRNEAMVQIAGSGYTLKAGIFTQILKQFPEYHQMLLRYVDSRMSQMAITAACNRLHHVEERLARWLLSVSDRVESDSFFLTQEFVATMLGVRRAGVTLAAGILQKAGLIDYRRGRMRIVDRERLEAAACECYEAGRADLLELYSAQGMAPSGGARSSRVKADAAGQAG